VIRTAEHRRAYVALLACTCGLLLVLPFITSFDDLLTAAAQWLGIAGPLQSVAPIESRMTVAFVNLLGVHAAAAGSQIAIWNAAGQRQTLFISWNCIGWQSLLLLILSLLSGLRGHYTLGARIQVILLGLSGTLCINLLRISAVCLIAAGLGHTPAIIFHDYGGTLMILAWLFAFWALAYRWILPEPEWKAS
jgi:exosortase/archaeosortase family protein